MPQTFTNNNIFINCDFSKDFISKYLSTFGKLSKQTCEQPLVTPLLKLVLASPENPYNILRVILGGGVAIWSPQAL
jgi:hypothetical protein